jgi:uncharacterized RDD family membrane protein YckC
VEGETIATAGTPAPAAARLAAYGIDLALAGGVALGCWLLAWLWLLATSDAGLRQPSDAAISVAIAAGFAWLPIWGAVLLLGWSRRGQSPGLAALALRVVGRDGTPPPPLRALARLIVLCAATGFGLLALVLLVGAAAAAAQQTLPLLLGLALLLPLALALADPLVWLLSPDHRPLHDLVAGTRVVRVAPPRRAAPVASQP